MPYLNIQTNKTIPDKTAQAALAKASRVVAKELGKPEQYMMVRLEPTGPMLFAGSPEPAAFLELRGLGLPESRTGDLSRLLCDLIAAEWGIAKDRIYINFADVSPSMWGWNSETF